MSGTRGGDSSPLITLTQKPLSVDTHILLSLRPPKPTEIKLEETAVVSTTEEKVDTDEPAVSKSAIVNSNVEIKRFSQLW